MPRKRPGETLTDKQRTFCNEYVIDLNATNAAIRAGYSEESAGSTASHLLDDPDVAVYIRRLQENKFLRLRITVADVLAELAKIGFAELDEENEMQEPRVPQDAARKSQDRKAESQRILASLSYKQGDGSTSLTMTNDGEKEMQEPRAKNQDRKEEHSMVKRAAMSYRRVVVDERTGTKTTYTFTLRDKIMALRIIAQHLGLLIPDKKEQKMELTLIRPKGKWFKDDGPLTAEKNDSREKRDETNVTK
jgi:phage terminase small subunit